MVLVNVVPVDGTAALGVLVVYSFVPGPVANMLTGADKLPVGFKPVSLSVQPKALLPETIFVPDPFIYIVLFRTGVPLVILSKYSQ
jgi:hypothetical protein